VGDELAGKVAIVTGGASGLGRGIVEGCVAAGAAVVIADVNVERGEARAQELGDRVAFCAADVSDADAVQRAVDLAVEQFGGLHVMVNNAGIGSRAPRVLDDDFRDFDRIMAVNVRGVLLGSQRAARHMVEHGGGSIVNITSIAGINPGAGLMAYRASKAAVIQVTRSIAIDLAAAGVRANCIAPAHIATEINAHYHVGEIIRRMQPLQRAGTPADVADTVVFLASDRSAQITGVVLPVDGGTTAGPPPIRVRTVEAVQAGEVVGKEPGR
jgi:NAD(P)-dependent dehydrogenase (short-subunit alcohol dehydrogenase family)